MKLHFQLSFGFLFSFISFAYSQDVAKLNSQNKSLTYDEAIAAYQTLAANTKKAKLFTEGLTDCGRPLHLFVISNDGTFDPESARKKGKSVILINNGIHPGEPDGIDASIRLSQDFLSGKEKLPDNVVICIVPVYNIDGSLMRNCCSRANQNGPEKYGFRGNAKNLDLNRDFIKADAENTRSLIKIFRRWDPDVFVDTHVSDGADYQYTITLISTQHNKLGGPAGEYLKKEMTPGLFAMMKAKGHEMSPYVNTSKYDDTPENGIYGFMEVPRFASGYAALFNCLAFVTETHMLKPFPARVDATIAFLKTVVTYTSVNSGKILEIRKQSKELTKTKKEFPMSWQLDSTQFEQVEFKGYEAEYRVSKVTGQEQLYFNQQRPFTRQVKFYDQFKPATIVTKPEFYILPQAWSEVVDRMLLNNIQMTRLNADTAIAIETYIINDFKTSKEAYEGHYLHHTTVVTSAVKIVQYRKGDYLIPVNQEGNRFIVETLEPIGPDSWFNWGFFDAMLQQKEWFSAYVFDGMAEKLLNENPTLKAEFEKMKSEDKEFASDSFSQLYFLYKKSPNFEDYRRYPVGRIQE